MTHRILSSLLKVLLAAGFLFLSSCGTTKEYPQGSISLDGVMQRTEIEGGCWVFQANDGQQYELVGDQAKSLHQEGRRAEIVVKTRPDLASICMVGRIVEVLEVVRTY